MKSQSVVVHPIPLDTAKRLIAEEDLFPFGTRVLAIVRDGVVIVSSDRLMQDTAKGRRT